ncbi:MAG: HEAT repeat domain-containing protein, partial [Promethearchaeota archaeon]
SISPYVLSLKEALRGKSIHALCNIGTSSIPSLLKSFKKADSGSLGVRILKGLGIFGVFILYFAYFGLINYISRSLIFVHNDSPLFSNILDFSDVYRIVSLLIGGIFGFFLGLLIHLKFNCPKNVRRAMILSGIGGIKEPLKDSIPEIIKTLGDLNLLSPYYQLKQNPIGAFIEDPFLKKAIVRIELCRTLGKIGIGSNLAVNVLVEKLLDNKQSVRREAALALGKLGSTASSAVPSLIQTLKDKKADIRWRAAEALGRIGQGTPQVISALEEVLYDKYDHVSAQAEFSLEKIKESQT